MLQTHETKSGRRDMPPVSGDTSIIKLNFYLFSSNFSRLEPMIIISIIYYLANLPPTLASTSRSSIRRQRSKSAEAKQSRFAFCRSHEKDNVATDIWVTLVFEKCGAAGMTTTAVALADSGYHIARISNIVRPHIV